MPDLEVGREKKRGNDFCVMYSLEEPEENCTKLAHELTITGEKTRILGSCYRASCCVLRGIPSTIHIKYNYYCLGNYFD